MDHLVRWLKKKKLMFLSYVSLPKGNENGERYTSPVSQSCFLGTMVQSSCKSFELMAVGQC